jgi:hypothetical protein
MKIKVTSYQQFIAYLPDKAAKETLPCEIQEIISRFDK